MYILVGTMVLSIAALGMMIGVESLLSSYRTAWQPNFIGIWSLGAIVCSIQLYRRRASGRWLLASLTIISYLFWGWFLFDEILGTTFDITRILDTRNWIIGVGIFCFFTGIHMFFGWVGYHPMLFDKETIVEEEGDTDKVLDVW